MKRKMMVDVVMLEAATIKRYVVGGGRNNFWYSTVKFKERN